MLNGDVQIFDDLRLRGNHVNQFIVNFVRVDVVHPNPVQAVNLAQLPQQLGKQPLVLREIRAVAAGVLGHHHQFLHAAVRQQPGLVEDVVQLTAAVPTPQVGNDAVGTAVVTALGDFQEGVVLRGGDHPAGFLLRGIDGAKILHIPIFQQGLDGGHDFRIAAGAQNAVHLGQLLENVPLIPLGQAAGD